jgi:hypothetical protein
MTEPFKLDFDQAVAVFDAHVAAKGYTHGPRPDRTASERTGQDDGWILRCYHPRWPGWQGTVYDGGTVETAADGGELQAVVRDQRKVEMLRVLDCAPWGDSLRCIGDFELTLALLEAATGREADEWDDAMFGADGLSGGNGLPWEDEFSVSPEAVASMSESERVRYVGRLVRSLRLQYGDRNRSTEPWQPGGLLHLLDPCQPADLLHLLADTYR